MATPVAGQVRALHALAADMRRAVWLTGAVVGPLVLLGCWWVAGPGGLLGGALGTVFGLASALFTLVLMHRTAARSPRAVMLISFGGWIQKMIFLLAALVAGAAIPGVHRMSLAVGLLVVLITVTAAEGWAAYRFRSFVLDVDAVPDGMTTSGSTSG